MICCNFGETFLKNMTYTDLVMFPLLVQNTWYPQFNDIRFTVSGGSVHGMLSPRQKGMVKTHGGEKPLSPWQLGSREKRKIQKGQHILQKQHPPVHLPQVFPTYWQHIQKGTHQWVNPLNTLPQWPTRLSKTRLLWNILYWSYNAI